MSRLTCEKEGEAEEWWGEKWRIDERERKKTWEKKEKNKTGAGGN
jgi:hypothetical protein